MDIRIPPKHSEIIHKACLFADAAHARQVRKYTGYKYYSHCYNVAAIVSLVTQSPCTIIAALLHDTLEDTDTPLELILLNFGSHVASLVLEVTDVSRPADGNRKVRKAIDLAHLKKSSPEAATIKLADMIDNTGSILKHDKAFAKIYLPEKAAILDVLRHGDISLWQECYDILVQGYIDLRLTDGLPAKRHQ